MSTPWTQIRNMPQGGNVTARGATLPPGMERFPRLVLWARLKYGNMGIKRTVSIRRIDLWGRKPLESKKMKQKMQKTEMSIFPIYFLANSFVNKRCILTNYGGIFGIFPRKQKLLRIKFYIKKLFWWLLISMTRPTVHDVPLEENWWSWMRHESGLVPPQVFGLTIWRKKIEFF